MRANVWIYLDWKNYVRIQHSVMQFEGEPQFGQGILLDDDRYVVVGWDFEHPIFGDVDGDVCVITEAAAATEYQEVFHFAGVSTH